MATRDKFYAYLLSLDTVVAVFISFILYETLPLQISTAFAKDVYGIAVLVLAIIFPVFVSALILLASSPRVGNYVDLVNMLGIAVIMLFYTLIIALGMYGITCHNLNNNQFTIMSKYWLVVFGFFFSYALLAAGQAARDALEYAKYRAELPRSDKPDGE